MATKETAAVLERTYVVPLRKESQKAPRWKRTRKTVRVLEEFLSKHMKSDNIKMSKSINEELWKHGIRNPPPRIKVTVTKDDKGVVHAELFGFKPKPTAENKKTATKKEATKEEKKEEKQKE